MIFSAAYWSDIRVCLFLSALLTTTSLAAPGYTQSLIIPDNTLAEDEQSVILPGNDSIPVELILNGAQRGQNLFHSFEEFNVDEGRAAYFVIDNNNIQNIFSRVTGNQPSNILGVLGTRRFGEGNVLQTNANLYFINPNGILFGPNPSLDLGGSFFATTSDAVQFGAQGSFSATNPAAPSELLTINPSAFLFGASPGTITNQSFARSSTASSFT
ncbi:MAG: filamentous hemagglutinin N-terminal domain-containing protein [Symploca sp. SIO2E9]|nr:filamentous hemagglutinin N-terminal domain-containing protein [Symploca sp. SIO2E9]